MSTLSFNLTKLKHTRIALKDTKGNDVMGTFIPDAKNDIKPTEAGNIYINCWVNTVNDNFMEVLKKQGIEATHELKMRISEEMGKKIKAWNEAHPDDKKYAPSLGLLDMGKPKGEDPSKNAVEMAQPSAPIDFEDADDDLPF